MTQAIRTEEINNEFQVINTSLPVPESNSSTTSSIWLKRARIISALVYILLQLAYFLFIIICIVIYPRCEKAAEPMWWMNSVYLRVSNHSIQFDELNQTLDDYRNIYGMDVLWLAPVLPLSNELNPLNWTSIGSNRGGESSLTNLINEAHKKHIKILVDYPLNHLSIQSSYFTSNDECYFVWNKQGNSSNWMTINDDEQSAWIYNNRVKSFYLSQFNNNGDSIDINYRNNRVFNDIINSFSHCDISFKFDGFNLKGISYAYEDYEYRNETNNHHSRTRHLEEDYLLLARIRATIDKSKIILLDAIDSLATSDDRKLTRYYGDKDSSLGGVQLASINNFILTNESEANVTDLFNRYYESIFFKEQQPFLWLSLSPKASLNEAFFAACLFHVGSISIDIDTHKQFSNVQLGRLRDIMELTRKSDVFRVGRLQKNILSHSQLLTIDRARRGSKHYMIIVNFNDHDKTDTIKLKEGKTNAVELVITNKADLDDKYKKHGLIDMSESITLKPYEYIIIRWSATIEGLGIIF